VSNNSFDQNTSPQLPSSEQLVARAAELIAKASRLHATYLSPGGVKDRNDELLAGPGYLSRLQKLGGSAGIISVGVTSKEAEGGYPARTLVLKQTSLGLLTIAIEDQAGVKTIEGIFTTEEAGIGEVGLNGDKAISAANAVISDLESEVARREDAYFEDFLRA